MKKSRLERRVEQLEKLWTDSDKRHLDEMKQQKQDLRLRVLREAFGSEMDWQFYNLCITGHGPGGCTTTVHDPAKRVFACGDVKISEHEIGHRSIEELREMYIPALIKGMKSQAAKINKQKRKLEGL